MLTDYTTYDDIRSTLGVSDDDIEDATLALETWDNHLQFDLEDVSASLPAGYLAVAAKLEESRTAVESKLYRATRLFATLATARALSASLPMFGPKDFSDGKATVSRFADAPYKAVVSKVEKQFEQAKGRLEKAWAEMNATATAVTSRPYMGVSRPSTDPVTGG